jgi:predicted O-methyltransferase YrrM
VKVNFRKLGLLDNQVRFIEGFFSESLPKAPVQQLALLRLDGDMYESTYVALETLYPKLSSGGIVIVDDYGVLPRCARAVEDYRSAHDIKQPMVEIDWSARLWIK